MGDSYSFSQESLGKSDILLYLVVLSLCFFLTSERLRAHQTSEAYNLHQTVSGSIPSLRCGLNEIVFTVGLAYARASDTGAERTHPYHVGSLTLPNGMLARLLQLTKVAC